MKRYALLLLMLLGLLTLIAHWIPVHASRNAPLAPIAPVTLTQATPLADGILVFWESEWNLTEHLVTLYQSQGWTLRAVDRRYPNGFDYAALVTIYLSPAALESTPTTVVNSTGTASNCTDYDPLKPGVQGPFPGAKCVNGGWR